MLHISRMGQKVKSIIADMWRKFKNGYWFKIRPWLGVNYKLYGKGHFRLYQLFIFYVKPLLMEPNIGGLFHLTSRESKYSLIKFILGDPFRH